jgi:hypothetical protein
MSATDYFIQTTYTPAAGTANADYLVEARFFSDEAATDPVSDWVNLGYGGAAGELISGPFPRPATDQWCLVRAAGRNALGALSSFATAPAFFVEAGPTPGAPASPPQLPDADSITITVTDSATDPQSGEQYDKVVITLTDPGGLPADVKSTIWIFDDDTGPPASPGAAVTSERVKDIIGPATWGGLSGHVWVRRDTAARTYWAYCTLSDSVTTVTPTGSTAKKSFAIDAISLSDQSDTFSVAVQKSEDQATNPTPGERSGQFEWTFNLPADVSKWKQFAIFHRATDSGFNPIAGFGWGHVADGITTAGHRQSTWWRRPPAGGLTQFQQHALVPVNKSGLENWPDALIVNVTVPAGDGLFLNQAASASVGPGLAVASSQLRVGVAAVQTSMFASGIAPVGLVTAAANGSGELVISKTEDTVYNTNDSKIYRWDAPTNRYKRPMPGADLKEQLTLDKLTAGQISAGAVGTTELFAGEILVGAGGGKPSRFRVNDSGGNQIGFIGDNGAGFVGAQFTRVRVGNQSTTPYVDVTSSSVELHGAKFELVLGGATTRLFNDSVAEGIAGLRVFNASNESRVSPGRYRLFTSGGSRGYFESTAGYAEMGVNDSGGTSAVVASGATDLGLTVFGSGRRVLSAGHVDGQTGFRVLGTTIVDASRNASFVGLKFTGQFHTPFQADTGLSFASSAGKIACYDTSGVFKGWIPVLP